MKKFSVLRSGPVIVLFCSLALSSQPTPILAEIIDFESGGWVLYDAEIIEHMDRQCLIGSAFLPHIAFINGIIEYDLAVDGSRGYPGISFRAESQFAYENFYCRPHVSGRPDALQYTAVFNGVAGWQLYNGPGFTAAAEIPSGVWIHVRLEIKDQRARVFFGDGEQPALVINDLKHIAAAGPIGIKSAKNKSACFSNFSVTKTDEIDLGPPANPVFSRGLITEWELSQPLRATDVDAEDYPDADLAAQIQWQRVTAEPNGLLDIARQVPRSLNGEADLVFARVFLEAEADEVRRFSFGYSDIAAVFLNGQLLFTGTSTYRSRDETFSGIVGLNDTLHLSLRQGRNELLFAVVEIFGGWGLMGQDNSDDFLHARLTRLWEFDTGNRLPESVVYDADREILYVTNNFRGGDEYISRVSVSGEVIDKEWVTGLNRPTGMAIWDDRLWVVDRQHLVEIDLAEGTIRERHLIPDPEMPNDVAFDDAGVAYVTDTRGSRIYRFEDGEFTVWLAGDEIDRPNGILVDGDRLLFGNGADGCLKSVDRQEKAVRVIACFGDDSNVDGLCQAGDDGYIVSVFKGRMYHVTDTGEVTELLNTTASGFFCADIEYVRDKKLIIVPGLFDNRLAAYRFEGL